MLSSDACVAGLCEGAPIVVDDGVDCTTDICVEESGEVIHVPSAGACDDGLFCTGTESCDVFEGCISIPLEVDDGVDCTIDSCSEADRAIVHEPSTGLCPILDGCAVQACVPFNTSDPSGCVTTGEL